eukprot:GHUV01035602.1.p1 GENE.GHUV01035602.1~~GHUV01035602.1.p1  ORF type:complete len:160 (+),score=1.77 GHUV01035602.1:505-984(+)
MALRTLVTGSDMCTGSDGAGPSNAVGALVNQLLGGASKTQEQLRDVSSYHAHSDARAASSHALHNQRKYVFPRSCQSSRAPWCRNMSQSLQKRQQLWPHPPAYIYLAWLTLRARYVFFLRRVIILCALCFGRACRFTMDEQPAAHTAAYSQCRKSHPAT